MKQTALEWLENELIKNNCSNKSLKERIKKSDELWNQAKQMLEKQIIEAHDNGYIDGGNKKKITAEQYYNETFNK